MFTRQQLELLEDLFSGEAVLPYTDHPAPYELSQEELKDLRGIVHSAIWNLTRSLPKKDKAAIEAARRAGITQIVGRNTEPTEARASRMKPEVVKVKDGDALLDMLGLK